MEEIQRLVTTAIGSDTAVEQKHRAFGELVIRFQDMAFASAYAVLGDFQLAQDAAQEAFLAAYQNLGKLKAPAAFAGWFRRIVVGESHRMMRCKRLSTVPLETALSVACDENGPAANAETKEIQAAVHSAIEALPARQRMVTTLFYINAYSHREIADFLEISTQTVDNLLRAARKRLKARMIPMVQETLNQARPSRNEQFVNEITNLVGQSQPAVQLRSEVQRLAKRNANVLVVGEPGTGKMLIAKILHSSGTRAESPFVVVDCSTLPADFDAGIIFDQAARGTLCLENVDKSTPVIQAQLTEALAHKPTNIRVIAIAHVDLSPKVEAGIFGERLYSCLTESIISAPCLRDCLEDLPLFIQHFAMCAGFKDATLSSDAIEALESYAFPNNMAELNRIIEQAVKASGGQPIQRAHLRLPN